MAVLTRSTCIRIDGYRHLFNHVVAQVAMMATEPTAQCLTMELRLE